MRCSEPGNAEASGGGSAPAQPVGPLVEHLFRHEAGRLTALLCHRFGLKHIELVEDAVHDALEKALRLWPLHGIPNDPAAWLFKTSRNFAIDAMRRNAVAGAWRGSGAPEATTSANDGSDETLAMIFACNHPKLPEESSLPLTLNVACGFNVGEVARALLLSEAAASQRIIRAKRLFKDGVVNLEMPGSDELPDRLEAVLPVLYLMFSEGYSATDSDNLMREDLCREAMRLAELLKNNPATSRPHVHALLSLFLLQHARFVTRIGAQGELCLLPNQDRSKWNRAQIAQGVVELQASMSGDEETVYHLEAAIAALHACAPSYDQTPWDALLELYDRLWVKTKSSVVALNRAVVVSRVQGPEAGLEALIALEDSASLEGYHWFPAARAELLRDLGRETEAAVFYKRALKLARNDVEKAFIRGRMGE